MIALASSYFPIIYLYLSLCLPALLSWFTWSNDFFSADFLFLCSLLSNIFLYSAEGRKQISCCFCFCCCCYIIFQSIIVIAFFGDDGITFTLRFYLDQIYLLHLCLFFIVIGHQSYESLLFIATNIFVY